MAVADTPAFSGPYLANGATTAFPFTFSVKSGGEVRVIVRQPVGGDTVILSPSLYSVTLTENGGTVTLASAAATGQQVLIASNPSFAQEVGFENGSRWLASPVNEANDRAAIRDQALKRDVARGLMVPLGEDGLRLPGSGRRIHKLMGFDSIGGLQLYDLTSLFPEPGTGERYDLYNSALDQTARYVSLLSQSHIGMAPGTINISNITGAPITTGGASITASGGRLLTIQGQGVGTTTLAFNSPASDPRFINTMFSFLDKSVVIRDFTARVVPSPFSQGVVTQVGVTGSGQPFFRYRAQPGFEPAWGTAGADNVRGYMRQPNGSLILFASDYKKDDQPGFGTFPYPVLATGGTDASTGWPIYEATPADRLVEPISISARNRFTLRFKSALIVESLTQSVVSGFTGDLAVLNGRTLSFEPVASEDETSEGGTVFAYLLDENGARMNLGTTTAPVTGGKFTMSGVPLWMAPGQWISLATRKRAGSFLDARGGDVTLGPLRLADIAAAPVNLYSVGAVHLDLTIDGTGIGGTTAGPVQIHGCRGPLTGRIIANAPGDDTLNFRTRAWNQGAKGVDAAAGWIDVQFPPAGTVRNSLGNAPKVGDQIRFIPPETIGEGAPIEVRRIGVSPVDATWTRVFFDPGAIPAGVTFASLATRDVPLGWAIWNSSTAGAVKLDEIIVTAGSARGAMIRSDNVYVGRLRVQGLRGSPLRTGVFGWAEGGFGGGHEYASVELIDNQRAGAVNRRSQIFFVIRKMDGMPITAPSGFKPMILGDVLCRGYQDNFIQSVGIDTIIRAITLDRAAVDFANRSILPAGDPNKYDFYAEQGTISVYGSFDPSDFPTYWEATGGYFHMPDGSMLRASGVATEGQTQVVAAKKVREPSHIQVWVDGTLLEPTDYSVDNSTTVVLTFPLLAGEEWSILHHRS